MKWNEIIECILTSTLATLSLSTCLPLGTTTPCWSTSSRRSRSWPPPSEEAVLNFLSKYFRIHIYNLNLYLIIYFISVQFCQVAAAKGESEDKHALIFALFALIALIGEGQREQFWISRAQVFASCVRLGIIFMDACSIPRLLHIHNIHVRY